MKYVFYFFLIGALIWCAFEPCPHPEFIQAFDPITGAILGGTALVGAGVNYLSSSESNSANAAMTREQMGWQSSENKLDRDFQRSMVPYSLAEQWKYNDPAFLANAYRNAGVNPAFALGGIKGGSGNSPLNGSSHSASPVPFQPYQSPVGNSLQGGLNTLSQLLTLEHQELVNKNYQTELDAKVAALRAMPGFYESQGNYYNKKAGESYMNWLRMNKGFDYIVGGDYEDYLAKKLGNEAQRQVIMGLGLDNMMKDIDSRYRDRMNAAQYNRIVALTKEALATANDMNMSARERKKHIEKMDAEIGVLSETEKNLAEDRYDKEFWNDFKRTWKTEIYHYTLGNMERGYEHQGLQNEYQEGMNNPVQYYGPAILGAGGAAIGAGGAVGSRLLIKRPNRIGFGAARYR